MTVLEKKIPERYKHLVKINFAKRCKKTANCVRDVKAIRLAINRHLKRPYLSNLERITAPSTQWVLSSNILNS